MRTSVESVPNDSRLPPYTPGAIGRDTTASRTIGVLYISRGS